MLIKVCNNNSNNRNKLTMHLLNSSSITSTTSSPTRCSRMASPGGTSRTVRVRVVRAPSMRTPTRRGTSSADPPVALPPTTVARVDTSRAAASGGVALGATGITGDSPAEGANPANITIHLILLASPCPASTHKGVSRHKSSHRLTSKL